MYSYLFYASIHTLGRQGASNALVGLVINVFCIYVVLVQIFYGSYSVTGVQRKLEMDKQVREGPLYSSISY